MSLPPARQDISEHPAKGSVSVPVDSAKKNADVDRKIRFYGIIDAIRKGRLPSNEQIDGALRYALDHSPVDLNKLSPEGRKLVQDTRDIIDTARLIVQEKNADELFQYFVWHTRDIDHEAIKPGDLNQHLPVDKTQAKSDSEQAVRHLRTLLHIVLTNSEARKLLSDFSVIGRDLLSKTAAKLAETIAPDQETLQRVDESAPSDQFITQGGQRTGPGATPVLEARLPGTDKTLKSHPHDDQVHLRDEQGNERPYSDIRSEGQAKFDQFKEQGFQTKEVTKEQARQHAEDIRTSDEPDIEAKEKKRGLVGKMKDMTQNIVDKIPQEHKDSANDKYERSRRFLTEEYFPQERRDQFMYRGKKVILECQKHEDYQESIRWLLGYVEDYAKHGRTAASSGTRETQSNISADPNVNLAIRELRTLLERFANGTSLDIVIEPANVLIDDSRRDPELREWFKSVDSYIRKILLQPGFVLEPECNNEGNRLRESGRRFFDDKYRSHFDNLFNGVSSWFNAMGEDPLNKRFGEDWGRLTKDLLFDSEGALKFKPELWNDIRKVILPQLIDKVGYIPIPRIEYTDDTLDLVVENLTLQGRNLFPNIISLDAHNFVKFSPYNAISDDNHHRITLSFEQMQADMRDVAFYYRKKTGIPRMTDSGIADVILGGRGMSATIELTSTTRDKSSVFKVQEVNVKIDSLKFSIRDSKHDFLYKTLKPLATGLVKRQIQKALRDTLTTAFEYIDGQLVHVRDRMASAKATEGETRTEALKTLFQRKKEEASVKSAERGSQFKIVSNKRNSLLSEGHPAGWINRLDEREKTAAQGHEWRSDAFTIVGGGNTTAA
jgi:hypothetical protein